MSGPTLHLALTRSRKADFATAALVGVLGLVVAMFGAGAAWAFPKPKYATSLPAASTPAPAPATPDDSDPAVPKSSSAKASTSASPTAKPAAAKAIVAKPGAPKPAAVATAPRAAAPTASGGWSIYQVRPGDTLTGVGRRFGANAKTLSDLNELEPRAPLRTGMKLKLPPGTVDKGKDPYASGPPPTTLSDVSGPAPNHQAVAGKPARAAARETVSTSTTLVQTEPDRSHPVRAEPRATAPSASAAQSGVSPLRMRSATTPDPALPGGAEAWTPRPAPAAKAELVAKAPSDAVASGRGRFVWPVKGEVVTRFGPLGPGQRNDGVNIAAGAGAPVEAAAAGVVVYAGSSVPGFGNLVLLKHADGWVTAYAHLGSISVRMRDHVAQGEGIGVVGQTGGVDRPQLHFEARFAAKPEEKARPVDPLALLPQ